MKRTTLIATCLALSAYIATAQTNIPLVFDKENTGAAIQPGVSPAPSTLHNAVHALPDPFRFQDGTRDTTYAAWERHRNEVARMVQDYEIGNRPTFDHITSSFNKADSTITFKVETSGRTLEYSTKVIIPKGKGPFPVVIGMNMPSGSIRPNFLEGCILIPFKHDQIIKSSHQAIRDTAAAFYKMYPEYTNTRGNYSGWSWGISRLIDALYQQKDILKADVKHIAVTGCSYAGKMAMFAGAFDERIALTIIQESGGGGINSWRVSDYYTLAVGGNVERVENTNYSWFAPKFKDDFNGKLALLPYDHHQIIAMIAPRAVLILGNPDFEWLCDYSGYVSSAAAAKVWDNFGIGDRFGYVVEGKHNHCMACDSQNEAVQQFVAKFLFGKEANTNIRQALPFKDVNIDIWTKNWK